MVCDYKRPQETAAQRAKRITDALQALAKGLQSNSMRVVIGPKGAITFAGWKDEQRGGLSDACAYRMMQQRHSFELTRAIAAAEMKSGQKVNVAAIGSGLHSHDGGKTWHPGH